MANDFSSWRRDELILAMDLYIRRGAAIPEHDPDVVALSSILRCATVSQGREANPRYRSTGSVHLKLQNFLAIDPTHEKTAMTHGARGDRSIWEEFARDPVGLSTLARQIRETALVLPALDDDDEDDEFPEGRVLYRLHRRYERNRALVARAKARFQRRHGSVYCEVCTLDFAIVYGDHGEGWIEVHHDVALSLLTPGGKTRLRDLRMLCANCHRMIHRKRPWLTVAQLGELVRNSRRQGGPRLVAVNA